MTGSSSASGGGLSSAVRLAITFVFTIVLVGGEFALLTGVYHRADPTRAQAVVANLLSGQIAEAAAQSTLATPVDATATGIRVGVDTNSALHRLQQSGADPDLLQPVQQAQQIVAEQPGSAAAMASLNESAQALNTQLADQVRRLDLEAAGIYAVMLLVVSIGWFLWFRRLVARHRALQQSVTAQEALAASEQRLLALVQNGADLVMVVDVDSTASFVSPSAKAVVGRSAESLTGTRFVDLIVASDVPLLVQILASQRAGDEDSVTLQIRHTDGRIIVVEGVLTNLLADPVVGGFVLTVRDVTDRQALEERLTHQAFHDSLTGLANRQLFADRLGHALERRPGIATPLVVLFCDLDDFKNINDSHGHGVGDQVLEVVGQRLRDIVRAGDTAARLGGDEFAILMENVVLDTAGPMAERIIEALREPIIVEGVRFPLTASIGMAQAVPGESTGEEVLRNADVAMYWAKDRGKATVASYDSALHAAALDRLELRADLQRALRNQELVLHYQPTVDLASGQITGFEALVRWQHPTRGLLAPGHFVPMAEETGLIVQLGTWVLHEACRTGAALQQGSRHPTMAVNVSAQQLSRPDFVAEVINALTESGLPADRLVLEITESVVLQNLEDVIPRLSTLRDHGSRVAIDDFGTGYSSLAYLSDLPIDILKVDKSFIDRVGADEQGSSVTQAIIAMSNAMNLSTVAEGVEQAAQVAWLQQANCPMGQGYFWSRPVDLAGVRQLLERSLVAGDGARLSQARLAP